MHEELIKRLRELRPEEFSNAWDFAFACQQAMHEAANAIEELEAFKDRKIGKWTLSKDGSGTCSECGRRQNNCWDADNWDNFCHFCGADMRKS